MAGRESPLIFMFPLGFRERSCILEEFDFPDSLTYQGVSFRELLCGRPGDLRRPVARARPLKLFSARSYCSGMRKPPERDLERGRAPGDNQSRAPAFAVGALTPGA